MTRHALSILFCLLSASSAFAQTDRPLEGVWKVTEEVLPGPNPVTIASQPSLVIFTQGYYSELYVMRGQVRTPVVPARDQQNFTDADKISRFEQWRPVVANSGTYEINGSTLTRRAIVAKNLELMTTRPMHVQELRVEDRNTIWLIPIAAQAANEPRIKLTRLE